MYRILSIVCNWVLIFKKINNYNEETFLFFECNFNTAILSPQPPKKKKKRLFNYGIDK